MRSFLDAILTFILCSTLSDDEWTTIDTLTDQSITLANYQALAGVLISRESVSDAQNRLKYYFMAGGVVIAVTDAPVVGKTDIYVGDDL